MDKNTSIQKIKDAIAQSDIDRNWKKFHDPKSMVASISVEASELQELFFIKPPENPQLLLGEVHGRKKQK